MCVAAHRLMFNAAWRLVISCAFTFSTGSMLFAQSSGSDESEIIKPERPEVSRSAEIERPGVLQIEVGYEGLFRSDEFHSHESTPLDFRYAPIKSLRLELETDPVFSIVDDADLQRATSFGDMRAGAEWIAADRTGSHPAVAFAYALKLPTASKAQGLGTGRFDHRIALLVTGKLGETDLDANLAYLNIGHEYGLHTNVGRQLDGRAGGALAAVSASREFKNKLGYVAEVSWQNQDDELPTGSYALGAVTFKASERARLDAGARVRLNASTAKWGLVGGVTVGGGG